MTDRPIGTITSDQDTPTFELVRVKLKAGCDLKPGALVKMPTTRSDGGTLIGRVRGAHEWNPNEQADAVGVRDTLHIERNYPGEEDSTTIYRLADVELIEEIVKDLKAVDTYTTRAPETLPTSGTNVYPANEQETVSALGLASKDDKALMLGHTASGTKTPIRLRREAIQRHFFICGTTGSGKSYAMGVLAEELIKQGLPVVFIDTQDEYAALAEKLGGSVVVPGKNFSIRISALTESELIDLLPQAMKESSLQCDIVGKAFANLEADMRSRGTGGFTLDDLISETENVAPQLCAKPGDVPRVQDTVKRRTRTLESYQIFGSGISDWASLMVPCLAIRCQSLRTIQLQSVATAVLRELQNLRLANKVPPYVAVVDEAHLFVPEGQESACKQIIREGVRIGRHHGICMVLLTQSPVDIDKRTIRQCNTRMVFALEPDQLDAIRGVKADASEEMLRALPKLPRGHCILSGTYESMKHAVTMHVRERETKDSEGGQSPPVFDEMSQRWRTRGTKASGA